MCRNTIISHTLIRTPVLPPPLVNKIIKEMSSSIHLLTSRIWKGKRSVYDCENEILIDVTSDTEEIVPTPG